MRIALLEVDCPVCAEHPIRFLWRPGGGAAVRHRCPECAATTGELERLLDERGACPDDRDVSGDYQRPPPPVRVATTESLARWREAAATAGEAIVVWREAGAVVHFGEPPGDCDGLIRSVVATADLEAEVVRDLVRADLDLRGVELEVGALEPAGDRLRVSVAGVADRYEIAAADTLPAIARRPTSRQLGGDASRYSELVIRLQEAIASGDDRAAVAAGAELLPLFARLWPRNRAGYVALASQVVAVDGRVDPERAAGEARRLLAIAGDLGGEPAARLSALAALGGVLEHWGWPQAAGLFERAAEVAGEIPGLEQLAGLYRDRAAALGQAV